jgi:hypothetical protein
MKQAVAGTTLLFILTLSGCNLLDPERPTPQPDTTVYGNLVEVTDADEGGFRTVQIQVGIPRALAQAKEEEGLEPPVVESGLKAEVRVGSDSLVVLGGEFVSIEAINPGSEVVVEPVLGTTRMIGSSLLRCEAEMVMDFATFATWKLPELPSELRATARPSREDLALINSDGVEQAPVVPGDGTVLYFSSRLRFVDPERETPVGARRDGLDIVGESRQPSERSYRAELGSDGWTNILPVVFEGLENTVVERVTWVDANETVCLVTVQEENQPLWFGRSERRAGSREWPKPEPMFEMSPLGVSDGVYLTGSVTKTVFVSFLFEGSASDLFLFDPKQGDLPGPLQPQISTPSPEWGPRTGPNNELFFSRGERQMVFDGAQLVELRLPGEHRSLVNQAAATTDGKWVFFCQPNFVRGEMDLDILVAPWLGGGQLGEAVPVDDWRPGEVEP